MLLVIWFETDAFVEYAEVFGYGGRFWIPDHIERNGHPGIFESYPEFLAARHDCFLSRLVSCPICCSVWLGLILDRGWAFLAVAFLGLLFYSLYLTIQRHD